MSEHTHTYRVKSVVRVCREYSLLSLSVHFVTKQILKQILASLLNEYLCFFFYLYQLNTVFSAIYTSLGMKKMKTLDMETRGKTNNKI